MPETPDFTPVILVAGNPIDGLEFHGPFANRVVAAEFANTDPDLPPDWWVAELQPVPKEDTNV